MTFTLYGNPTLSEWVMTLRHAATIGQAPKSFVRVTRGDIVTACLLCDVAATNGRVAALDRDRVVGALRCVLGDA